MNKEQHGNVGNRNAAKADEDKKQQDSYLRILCWKHEKAAWVRAASGKKLSQWVRDTLNKEAQKYE